MARTRDYGPRKRPCTEMDNNQHRAYRETCWLSAGTDSQVHSSGLLLRRAFSRRRGHLDSGQSAPNLEQNCWAERVLYWCRDKGAGDAETAFNQSFTMDGYVGTAGGFGHDLLARSAPGQRAGGRDAAERRIAESLDHFEHGSSGESLAMRSWICLLADRPASAGP